MRTLTSPAGIQMPVFGLGTWHMGEQPSQRRAEIAALQYALDQGIQLIDTAEMYGEGGAEEVVGQAIQGRRDELTLVSKVYPHNATRGGAITACERSLRRLQTDRIDFYLLHWRGSVPLVETFEAFMRLQSDGKILDYGVSNFDHSDLRDIAESGLQIGSNQILYNLTRRQAEWAVLPWCREQGVPVMAYSPLEQGRLLLGTAAWQTVAIRHEATPAQIALAWLLHQDGVVVIPKSSQPERIEENLAALEITLNDEDLRQLNQTFPPPSHAARLGIL